VFHTADILIDGQPVLGRLPRERPLDGMGIGKPGEIPGALDEGVEGVRLAPGRSATARAVDMAPGRVVLERVARPGEIDVVR